ncbi:MAG: hypothetical protein LUD73_06995, partial [Lachnospiraceae bacterium]|nr:hypothetical protein [Lachnospiraceae bacterium]
QEVRYAIVDEPNAEKQSSASYAIEIWKNIMEDALPYLNIPQTEEIPEDLLDEIEAEEEESTEESETTEEEETEDGTLVDPQTGETVTMPDPETEDSDDVLGDTPVNDNLVDVEPEDALSEDEDENPTE